MTDQKFDLKIDCKEVLARTTELLQALKTHKQDLAQKAPTYNQLEPVLGLKARSIKRFTAESKSLTSLRLTQIAQIIERCQQQTDSNGEPVSELRQRCLDLADAIFKKLDQCGISPTEYAFRSKFHVAAPIQKTFSESCAGKYAIVRLTSSKEMEIAPIKIDAQKPGAALCRFETEGFSKKLISEQKVTGYIYESDDGLIHAVGGIGEKDHIRSTLLTRVPGEQDLYGLRVADSGLDGGPFAHRLYCKRVMDIKDHEWPASWRSIFTLHTLDEESLQAVRKCIQDIDWILKILMKPPKDLNMYWGVGLPEDR